MAENRVNLIFICNFNKVRSVVAECVFRRRLEEKAPYLFKRIGVSSAGLITKELRELLQHKNAAVLEQVYGTQLPRFVLDVMLQEEGVDLTSFRSILLTEELVKENDLVIPVTRNIKDEIHRLWPWSTYKVFNVEELTGIKNSNMALGEDDEEPYGSVYVNRGIYDPDDGGITVPYEMGASAVRQTRMAVNEVFEGILKALLNLMRV